MCWNVRKERQGRPGGGGAHWLVCWLGIFGYSSFQRGEMSSLDSREDGYVKGVDV